MKQPLNKSPLIGVTPLWDAARQSVWMLPDYLEGIKAAGGLPVVLPLEVSEEDVDQIVNTCDGFLFTGGQDVSPSLYGMEDATGTIVSSLERDQLESLLLSKALLADKPILGICRGLQFINAFLGGTLWQDLPSQHPSEIVHRQGKPYGVPTHQVALRGDLQALLCKDVLEVNTLHHQAVKDLGSGLTPMAVAPDGIIEAFMLPGKRFVWAVQWHPEYLFRTDKDSLAIFACFVKHCCR
ncbi:MAG: gamma-glutamyl-gamma-aminobutyrate hydrolase family protein [Bacteroidales bacterium]|nr:gamma-glutamyl-gamma-aminobutyrate hydrolase family protein [Bacteroidales bacterium]